MKTKIFWVLLCIICGATLQANGNDQTENKTDFACDLKTVMKQVQPIANELSIALKKQNEQQILLLVQKLKTELGEWAGKPEKEPSYYMPASNKQIHTFTSAIQYYDLYINFIKKHMYKGNGEWKPEKYPPQVSPMLRFNGYLICGFSEILDYPISNQAHLKTLLVESADYLCRQQLDSGMFPFPDLRGIDKNFSPTLERFYERNPNAFANNWVIQDDGSGGTLFDTGVCGVAMLDAYKITLDKKYLAAAQKAADYCTNINLVKNWNYNAFSVWLLAKYFAVTQDTIYLNHSVQNCKLGVLPGLMENGRWVDPHNACTSYHVILTRGMLALYQVLPQDHPFYEPLKQGLFVSLQNLATEINNNGYSTINALSVLVTANEMNLKSADIDTAINIIINAMFEQSQFGTTQFKARGDEALPLARMVQYFKN